MKKIIVISKDNIYYSGASTTVILNIIENLSSNYKVTVITTNINKLSASRRKVNSLDIIEIGSMLNLPHIIVTKTTSFLKLIFDTNTYENCIFIKLIYTIKKLTTLISVESNYVWGFLTRKLIRIIRLENANYIFTYGMPYSNIKISNSIKKKLKHLKLILFLFDLYYDNPTLELYDKSFNFKKKRGMEEIIWMNAADTIFALKYMYNSYFPRFDNIKFKIKTLELPLVYFLGNKNKSILDSSKIKIVYTGQFYKGFRDYQILSELFKIIDDCTKDYEVHFYGPTINYKFVRLFQHGMVSKENALNAIKNADILLNFSNDSSTQIPSKIYEYISTGNKIINVYHNDNDLCKKELTDYRYVYNLKISEMKSGSIQMDQFCDFLINSYENISFEEVMLKYKKNSIISVTEYIEKEISLEK